MRVWKEIELLASGARTTSGDTKEHPVVVGDFNEINVFLDVTAVSGTSPTLDVKIVTLDPVSGKWFPLITFDTVTTVDKGMAYAQGIGAKIAVEWTIGGTAPSFTFSIGAVLKT